MGNTPNMLTQNPATASGDVFKQYDKALELLACRMLAEPYNAHLVASEITPAMLIGTYGEVVQECVRQYTEERRYSPQSVALALRRDKNSLVAWAMRDAEIDLPAAWEMFFETFGQYVEQQIAESVAGWIRQGMGSEEIKTAGDKIRRDKGLAARLVSDDGKADFEKELIAAMDGRTIDYPVKTPLKTLSEHMPYFEPGEYCIVAGRTGMGKSYFGQNCILRASLDGVPSAYVNLENKPKHMQKRLWQMQTGVRFERNMGYITGQQRSEYSRAWNEVTNFPTRIFSPGRSLQQVCNAIRSEHYERGIQLAVIDYIQLMRSDSRRGRVDELAEISAELRELALSLNIALVVLAQMNRESEKAGDKRPTLTGIRSSGDLEQDATSVFLLYRPSYYLISEDEDGMAYPPEYADIFIAKGRETGPGFAKCRFNHILGFYDADESQPFTQPAPAADWTIPASAGRNEDVPF